MNSSLLWWRRAAVPVCAFVFAACTSKPVIPPVHGKLVAKAVAMELFVSSDGAYAATLADPQPTKEPGAPQDIMLGTLTLGATDGSSSRILGHDVSNLAGSVLFSPDGKYIACLAGFSVRHGAGELKMTRSSGGDAESLGDGVTFFEFSPDSQRIAWVSDGVLFVRGASGGTAERVTDGVSTVEFAPSAGTDGPLVLVKRGIRNGGALLAARSAAPVSLSAIARGVTAFGFAPSGSEYAFHGTGLLQANMTEKPADLSSGYGKDAPDAPGLYLAPTHVTPIRPVESFAGTGHPKLVTTDAVSDFKFSKSGTLAYLTVPPSGTSGDLYIVKGTTPERVATKVNQFQFAPDGSLVFLANFSQGASSGTLGALPPNGVVQQIAMNVRQFTFSQKGGYVLYSVEVFHEGAFSLGLAAHKLGAPPDPKPVVIDEGVYGYTTNADDSLLAYKAHCIDNGKSCGLFIAKLADSKPIKIADRVGAFDFNPNGLVVVTTRPDGELTGRLLFTLGFMRPEAGAPIQPLEDQMTGDFIFAGPKRDRIAYLSREKGREGLYSVDLGTPPAVPPPMPK